MLYTPTDANMRTGREILEKKIEEGRKSALALLNKVNSEVPTDAIVKGAALKFRVNEDSKAQQGLLVTRGGGNLKIHKHALGQIATRAGVPSAYLAELAGGPLWQRDLAAKILGDHYSKGDEAGSRFLVRAVKGELRGFLSDKYRRLDSRPLIDAFAVECKKIGAVPVDGTISDTRVGLKAIIPTVYEPIKGEILAFGLEWHNSDFGAGMHSVRAFILRLLCLNGATMENALAQVHLGAKLSSDIELSERTYKLDTQTSISALRDVVVHTLSSHKIEALCDGIREAGEKQIDWGRIAPKLRTKLLKSEMEAAQSAFDGNDTHNLPAGKSLWRASNAISWIAGNTEDADRKLELQRYAGEILEAV